MDRNYLQREDVDPSIQVPSILHGPRECDSSLEVSVTSDAATTEIVAPITGAIHSSGTLSGQPTLIESAHGPSNEHDLWATPATDSGPNISDILAILNEPDDFNLPCPITRQRLESNPEENEDRVKKLSVAVRTILECIGEDPEREGLRDTPQRYARALLYFTKGYEENVRDLVNGAIFHEDCNELVIVRDIDIFSLCEHHMIPFTGKMHIGYIPDGRVLGLSKFARLAEMFSRRLQVQERLTNQVAQAICAVLQPRGVGVVIQSSHLCMVMRGVQKAGSSTTTSCMLGCMRSSAKTREEFMMLLCR